MSRKRLFALAALVLLAASAANAGVIRFTAKRLVKPAAKHAVHGTKAVAKAAYKVAI